MDTVALSSPAEVAYSGSGGLSELGGADAQADLAAALVRSTVQLTEDGLREALFIVEACGMEGLSMINYVMEMKQHQSPGSIKKLIEAIKALALYEHLKGFNLNLGGK
jgi:hypothetical protein